MKYMHESRSKNTAEKHESLSKTLQKLLALYNNQKKKKKDLTTAFICLSNLRAESKITPRFFTEGFTWRRNQISQVAIKSTWHTCRPKHNNLRFALVKMQKV